MEVVLIQCPNPVLSDPTTRWPLGLGYLQAVLERQGVKVTIADLRDKTIDLTLIPHAPVVGITATTGEILAAKEIASLVKRRNPKAFTIIGGPHATYLPEDCEGYFDLVIAGEAENEIVEMVRRRQGGTIYCKPVQDLDTLPFATRYPFSFSETLFEGAGYGEGPICTSILTARGCPYNCAFCQAKPRPVRFRSPENIIEEIKEIQSKWGCHHFRFEDDTFTLKPERVFKLCHLLEPLKIKFRCHTRSDHFNSEMARAMRLSGCEEVGFGVETADQNVLDIVNKKERIEQHIKTIRIAEDSGIKAKAFFMTGLPGETDEIINLTKDFLERAQPSKIILSRFTPYPGCDVWANPAKYGVAWIDPDFSHYWNFPHSTTIAYRDTSAEVLDQRYKRLHNLLWSGEWTSQEARRQREQLQRYLSWVESEGGIEGPTRIDTMVKAWQLARMKWLKEHCVGTVLEVGCNFGIVLAWCGGQAGVDLNPHNIALAGVLAPKRKFLVASAQSLPFKGGEFDTVMLPDILEHLLWADVPKALQEASRVAQRKVLITIPDGEIDTLESTSFKHTYLATTGKVQAIVNEFSRARVVVKKKGGFILIEANVNGY